MRRGRGARAARPGRRGNRRTAEGTPILMRGMRIALRRGSVVASEARVASLERGAATARAGPTTADAMRAAAVGRAGRMPASSNASRPKAASRRTVSVTRMTGENPGELPPRAWADRGDSGSPTVVALGAAGLSPCPSSRGGVPGLRSASAIFAFPLLGSSGYVCQSSRGVRASVRPCASAAGVPASPDESTSPTSAIRLVTRTDRAGRRVSLIES